MQKPYNLRIKHIGINNLDEDTARRTAAQLCGIFGMGIANETDGALFVGDEFEVMKHDHRGKHGHIAIQVDDVEVAMRDMASRGIEFLEASIRYNAQGKINFIFLKQEIAGFAIHLTE